MLLGGFLFITGSRAPSESARPPDAVAAAAVSVPVTAGTERTGQPVVPESGSTSTTGSPVNTLPYFPIDPAPVAVGTTEPPNVSPEATAPTTTTVPVPMATGNAPAIAFTVDRIAGTGGRPRAWVVRSVAEARASLGVALPSWIEQFPFAEHVIVVLAVDAARERSGCTVLRISWARAGLELAIAPHTACYSGSDPVGALPAAPAAGQQTIAALALPGTTVSGVTQVTTP